MTRCRRIMAMLAALALLGLAPLDLAWQPHPGAPLPLAAVLRDEQGRAYRLAAAFGQTPVILVPGYYRCPSLCGVVRDDLIHALAGSGLVAGRDYRVLAISIDPRETPADAAAARRADLSRAGLPRTAAWRYLTGRASAVAPVLRAVGFRDRFDPALKQFLHPTGIVTLTRRGRVSGYVLGVGYGSGDLRSAVVRARDGGISQAALPVLLLCFHFDPTTGRYTLAVMRILELMGGLTVVMLGVLLLALHRTERRPAP